MKNQHMRNNKKRNSKKSPIFLIALFNFLIITLILIYIIYLRFIPYKTITYDGFAVSGKDIVNNLLNSSFDVSDNIGALQVKDQDEIYQNLKSYYVGADKKKDINLNYPIYVNDNLALYNLSSDVILVTDAFQMIEGYSGFTLTSGALYNANTLERADYHNYILMRNSDNMYINTKEIKVNTSTNKYTIKMNSIINYTDEFITYYTLKDGNFVYGKILDVDMGSDVIIKDFNQKYTYKEFLIGLGIIREEKPKEDKIEENIIEEEKEEKEEKEEPKEENKIIIEEVPVLPENIIENEIQNEVQDPIVEEPSEPNTDPTKWQKPTVSCTDFIPNVYTATTEISLSDPSGVINKAITFTFYIDGEIAFRNSALAGGPFKVTKLIPNTKYKVIGTYQYKNEDGGIIEVKFLDQEFKTLDSKNIRPIDLSFKNGPIYADKMELLDLKIASDINDEAIAGVSRAAIEINGVSHSIGTALLRSLLRGNAIKYETIESIESNTKIKYEIKFYDTANNEMKLNNNTGATVTSKKSPSVKVRVKKQNIISVELGVSLSNSDNVSLTNYKYILYSSKGEVHKTDKLLPEINSLVFEDLNPQETYTIKVYADFDIEDGNGYIENQEIGNATFTTEPLSKLGSLKVIVECDTEKDLTYNKIKFSTSIDRKRTDSRLLKILKTVKIEIQDENKQVIKSIDEIELNELMAEGIVCEISGLESNTKYNIIVTAKALQGNVEEDISTTYTFRTFTTRKKPADFSMKNVVVTTNLIDLDAMVFDKDGASLDGKYIVELRDANENLIDAKTINSNEYTRCTYDELIEGQEYKLTCYAAQYNETNDTRYVQGNYIIFTKNFITEGLGGNIELTGLIRENNNSKNLIDVESYNNWYSKCFDVLTTEYIKDEDDNTTFKINSENRYGKTYNSTTKELTLTSNQCYVYNLKEYAGKQVTMSFKAKVSDESIKEEIYLQKGKELGENIEKITGLTTNYGETYVFNITIPKDGYIGFYLSKDSEHTLVVQNLQVELGATATDYQDYTYNLITNIQTYFIDENYVTYNGSEEEDKYCEYYIKLAYKDSVEEYRYQDLLSEVKDNKSYKIEEATDSTVYKIQLLIKVYEREYVLDEISFKYDPETCYEIKSINSLNEFKDIQPYGNYIILNNLDLRDYKTISEYTFGNANIAFYGSIDFNGKTIKRDVYSSNIGEQTTSYIFYNLAETAVIKNTVIDVYIDNINPRYHIDILDGTYPLFLYNNGNIDNIKINVAKSSEVDKRYVGLMGYKNLQTGIIENFIINYDEILYGTQYIAGGVLYSNGIIQNGYVYGKGIEAISDIVYYDSRNIGGLVYELQNGGVLQNVYNLAGIKINHINLTNSFAANIAYKVAEGATLRNVYSLKELTTIYENNSYDKLFDQNNKEVDYGPNIYTSKGDVQFSYYFCGTSYDNTTYNIKQDGTVLNDYNFQDNLLNANNYNAFNVEKYVKNGYYPHLKLNACMPTQEKIAIEMSSDNNILDVLSSEIVEYDELSKEIKDKLKNYDFSDENVKIAQINIYNPSGRTITNINIDYITDTEIIHQNYSKKMSTVYAVLSNPTTFINEYNISSVSGKNITGNEKVVNYGNDGDLGVRTIEVSFVKYIKTAEEWDNIDSEDENGVSGLIQNYKLDADLDFKNSEYSPAISGEFTGTIDGQGHTLSNITTTISLFERLSTSLKNLNINGYYQTSNSDLVGLIGELKGSAIIDNVHMVDVELISEYTQSDTLIGGICGYITASVVRIQNCSVNGLTIDLDKEGTAINHFVGGIAGYWQTSNKSELNITNCYVQGLNINAKNTNIGSIGGIIGTAYNDQKSTLNIEYCYTEGKISTDKPYAGGIYGLVSSNNTANIKYCYSLVNLTGNMTTGNEYIGGIGGYHPSSSATTNNIYLGNIYTKKASTTYSRRIVGNQENSKNYNNYGYIDQIINGKKTTDAYGATKLFTYGEIFTEATYVNILKFGENKLNYNYDELTTENGLHLLPKLYDTHGVLLPNQKDITIESGLKVMSITDSYTEDEKAIEVTVVLENIDYLEVTGFVIENEDLTVEDKQDWKITNEEQNGINYTTITFKATPNKYYDTYKLSEIIYINSLGQEKRLDSPMKISKSFYKEISNAQEWNEKMNSTSAENYKIIGNIDFSEVSTIKTNVSVGRLIADSTKTISNATLTFKEQGIGLIKEVNTQIKNLRFENININSTRSEAGIIYKNNAPMSNCSFDNIQITASGCSYIGIIVRSNEGSSIDKVTMNNVKVKAYDYVGGLCAYKKSTGNITNITGTYISVISTGDYVGGMAGYVYGGRTNNIKIYQYSSTGMQESDTATEYLAYGKRHVGGCVGYAKSSSVNTMETRYSKIGSTSYGAGGCLGYLYGSSGMNITSANNSVISKSYYVGGCVGYAYGDFRNFKAEDNELVSGTSNVGGCVGQMYLYGAGAGNNITSSNNKEIKGTSKVGGCIGVAVSSSSTGTINNVRSYNNTVSATTDYVGGCIGTSSIRIRNLKTYYDNKSSSPNIYGRDYIGGIIGQDTYNVTNTGLTYYSADGASVENANISGANYVGGFSGDQRGTVYGAAINNTTITARGNYAGGITGYYQGSKDTSAAKLSCKNFYIMHSFCTNSIIQANSFAGGIAGYFVHGNIQYNYVGNTDITAATKYAGGIAGYLYNANMTSKQYITTMKYNFVANPNGDNRVYSPDAVGGLIGGANKEIYVDKEVNEENEVISKKYYIESNLVVNDIYADTANISMGIGLIDSTGELGRTQSENMNKIYVFDCSYIVENNNMTQVYLHNGESQAYNIISSQELNNSTTYTATSGLNFADSLGRFKFEEGYFPVLNALATTTTQTYWGASYLNVQQDKIAIPDSTRTLNTSKFNLMKTTLGGKNLLPNMYSYTVDVDKINIEFSEINLNSYFDIKTINGEVILESMPITERVYTFKYDYNTPLIVTISNLDTWNTEIINKENVQNLLDIENDEYLYILDNKLYSSKREFEGEYLNLYEGKVLSSNGSIYNVSTMDSIEKHNNEIKLLEVQIPISKSNYEGIDIHTFYHCSKVIQGENNYLYKDQQIFIKNGTMYLADGDLDSIGNGIIIDSYNEKQYETILGVDGSMYDLLTKINYPNNFKNENIIAMTNNVSDNNNIVLVYYSSGRVYGFNYITGEEVFDNNVGKEEINLLSYIVDSLNLSNELYEMKKSNYIEAQELTEKLEHISIDQALQDITERTEQEENITNDKNENDDNLPSQNKDINEKYVPTYDAKTQSYVVYSTSELLVEKTEKAKSENEKINNNNELISYYTNISTSKTNLKDIGIVIITMILLAICSGLVVMYKKNNKRNR